MIFDIFVKTNQITIIDIYVIRWAVMINNTREVDRSE
jgi:hypothetical protein